MKKKNQKNATDHAIHIAVQCWARPKTKNKKMDVVLAAEFARVIDKYLEALLWCSGSRDFCVGGQARQGWEKPCKPLIDWGN